MFDTIVALATAPIKSAIAVIRLSGEECFNIVSKVFTKNLTNINERKIHYGHIVDENGVVDEVMLITYINPHSFTGENCVEIMCHGSPLIANEIIELLISKGARLATKGEFTSRAYLNKKIDLIQAEAINDVINATSSEAKKLSLLSLNGDTSKLIEPLKKDLFDLISNIEVNIDYPEYQDIEIVSKNKVIEQGLEIHKTIVSLINDGVNGIKIKEGIQVAIVGAPNVGKSSLLNCLIKENKAIVTDVAGTTRDVVEGDFVVKGLTFHLFDTAGIHASKDIVEQIGITKAKETIQKAEIVILLIDAEKGMSEEDQKIIEECKDKQLLVAFNKSDKKQIKGEINISAKESKVDQLVDAMIKLVNISEESFTKPSLNNARQIGLLKKADLAILKAIEDAKYDLPIDLIAVSLTSAVTDIQAILGDEVNLDLAKEIFSRFCVGK